mmetsp:Transcript_27864/g.55840  ORF Transcript_27864/g.55840 Transcript_27864/m.55840 type:complete len:100 (+) Transcript_27864:57-356(+)
MHPPLHKVNSQCVDVVQALESCHSLKPYKKFFGACNFQKAALDACFRREKKSNQSKSLDEIEASRRRIAAGGYIDESLPFAAWEEHLKKELKSKSTPSK